MIHVKFNPADPTTLTPAQLTWWTAWEARAKAATTEVLDDWEVSRKTGGDFGAIFNRHDIQQVWADLKNWLLLNVFNEKCAYCETKLIRDNYHAEHYRPKRKVTSYGSTAKVKDEKGKDLDHPGYFWLAFHWSNLLPACSWCNTGNGKRNEFPISKTTYLSVVKKLTKYECNNLKQKLIKSTSFPDIFYFQPVDLDDKEGRLLLHPYFDDPRKYLKFDEYGKAIAVGKGDDEIRGKLSIKVYNLNQGKIVRARREAQAKALFRFNRATEYFMEEEQLVRSEAKKRAKERLLPYIEGKEQYSAAVVDFMREEAPAYFK